MEFSTFSIVVLLIAFTWSGVVRSGLGFGGAGLMYPIAFLAVDSVVFIVPIVGVQLLIFSGITLALGGYKKVDWKTTLKLMLVIMPMYLVGVFGLLNFSEFWLLMLVYLFMLLYSLAYIVDYQIKPSVWLNLPLILLGAYMGGLSLSGAPLVAAVALQYLHRSQARESMFVLWFVMVAIKLATLNHFQIDLQLEHQLWLLPAATIGHFLGLKLHTKLMNINQTLFYRWIGVALFGLSLIGLVRHTL